MSKTDNRYIIGFLFLIFFTEMSVIPLCGQILRPNPKPSNIQSVPIVHIGISKGLSQGMINDLAEDADGYLWIATKDGLNRFDGVRFDVFRQDKNDSLSLSDNFVYSLIYDVKGRLWVGTQSGGINLFHPETEAFQRFNTRSAVSLSSDLIGDLITDMKGNLYVETLDKHGFNVIHENETGEFRMTPILDFFPGLTNVIDTLSWTKYLAFDKYHNLWYADRDSLFLLDPEAQKGKKPCLAFYCPTLEAISSAGQDPILMDPEKEGVYIRSSRNTLLKYNRNLIRFDPFLVLPDSLEVSKQLFIDKNQRLWAWQENNNAVKIHLENSKVEYIKPIWQRLEKAVRNHRGIALQDRMGNYWMGTGGNGLLKVVSFTEIFHSLPDEVMTRDHDIRLHRIDVAGCKHTFDQSIYDLWMESRKKLNLSKAGLKMSDLNANLVYDKEGYFWYGAIAEDGRNLHLLRINPEDGSFVSMAMIESNKSDWFAMPIFLDRNNEIWFGEKLSGDKVRLYHLSESRELESFPFPIKPQKHQYRFISDYIQDVNGLFWLGTTHGLFSFNPVSHEWQRFEHNSDDPSTLSSNLIFSLSEDPEHPDKFLWIGTGDAGLNRLDKRTGIVTRYNGTGILPNEVVYGIQQDNHGHLWISTNYGLTSLDTKSMQSRVFTTDHGLPGEEFNRYEYSRSADGELYFGGTSGVVAFNPNALYSNRTSPNIRINSIAIMNEEIPFSRSGAGGLNAPINRLKEITLPYDYKMLTIGFSTLDMTAPEEDRFRYYMKGWDDKWVETGTHYATFTNLEPGNYTFVLEGANSTGQWNKEALTLSIHILSPWWGTIWFRALMLAVIIGALYLLYRIRLNQVLKVERLRNNIAQDLHDEVGSTLSSISIYNAILQRNLPPDNTQSKTIERISTAVSEALEQMNDIVWAISSENDDLAHVVNRMRGFAVKLTEAKGIRLQMNVDEAILASKTNMKTRKNVYFFFKEAVNNCMKYSQCTELRIDLLKNDWEFTLRIHDNGLGFDPVTTFKDKNKLGGKGIPGMRMRAAEIGGSIEIESQSGKGCTIILKFS